MTASDLKISKVLHVSNITHNISRVRFVVRKFTP